MISRASFGIVLSIGAMLLFAIWPNIILLQQHIAMAQIIPGVARPPPSGPVPPPSPSIPTAIGGVLPANTTAAGAPANTTAAGAPANTTAAGAPANTTGLPFQNYYSRPHK
jgi:hypothetical protein